MCRRCRPDGGNSAFSHMLVRAPANPAWRACVPRVAAPADRRNPGQEGTRTSRNPGGGGAPPDDQRRLAIVAAPGDLMRAFREADPVGKAGIPLPTAPAGRGQVKRRTATVPGAPARDACPIRSASGHHGGCRSAARWSAQQLPVRRRMPLMAVPHQAGHQGGIPAASGPSRRSPAAGSGTGRVQHRRRAVEVSGQPAAPVAIEHRIQPDGDITGQASPLHPASTPGTRRLLAARLSQESWPEDGPEKHNGPATPRNEFTRASRACTQLRDAAPVKWTTSSKPAIRKVTAIWSAITCGAILGIGVHWMTGTGDSGRSQVKATVLESGEPELIRPAIGQWTTPEGERRYGVIPAPRGHAAGAEHPVWIDEAGNITHAPANQVSRIARASLAGATGTAGVILLTWPRPAAAGEASQVAAGREARTGARGNR